MSFSRTTLLLFYFFAVAILFSFKAEKSPPVAIVIHGGAGTILKENMSPEMEKHYTDKMNEALQAGYKILQHGGTSISAVEAAIKILEDSPLFNAGKGAVFNNAGENELDASIMDGKTLAAGSVAGVRTVKNPISAAIGVMQKSPHVMMTGKGADEFAKSFGLEIVDPIYFKDEKRYQQWQKQKEKEDSISKAKGSGYIAPIGDSKFGTVGCVALDKDGNLAAGTSTGGMSNKKFGRVGDSPIIGAGTYANNKTCAVSATGHGEYFIRLGVARDISALMEYKKWSVKKASEHVIYTKLTELGGTGGVIALDKNGNIAMPFNTAGMYRGFIDVKGKKEVLIYK
ncbi:MAG: isoaspartyl peptidase/L-asparaginase family protein [Bacteroidia bacterium]